MATLFTYLDPSLTVATLVLAFVLGAVFASFITCVADRIVAGESPWSGRSHCDACGHQLGAFDLVPVLSWLVQRGKCRYCGASIPARCVIAEALLGLAFVLIVLKYGIGVTSAAYCALAVILLGLSLVDLDSLTIPNGFILAGMLVWIALLAGTFFTGDSVSVASGAATASLGASSSVAAAGSGIAGSGAASASYGAASANSGAVSASLGTAPANEAFSLFAFLGIPVLSIAADGIVAALLVGLLLLLLSVAMDALLGRPSLGGGDVKLLFMVGLFLGLNLSLLNLMLACVFGLVFAFVGKSTDKAFPFGPAISAATMVTLLWGVDAMSWYVGLLC